MDEYPTAKEAMEIGKLKHLKFLREGVSGIHYYAEIRSEGKFNLICVYSASEIGAMLMLLMKAILYPIRLVLNLFQKDLGNAVFGELFDEIDGAIKALMHKGSLGSSITISYAMDSIEDCLRAAVDHSERKLQH